MLGWQWSNLESLVEYIRAVDTAEEAEEEDMDKAVVQSMENAEEEEDYKINHIIRISSKLENSHRHSQRSKRELHEAVFTVREITTSVNALNSPKTKKHSSLSKPRRGQK